ncbi:zinc transporter ZIP11 isoform X2 [Bacillus rossius redtenbacheri]
MLAASYWSLLDPAIELAEQSGLYGENGAYAFVPVAVGFVAGAAFVYAADLWLSLLGIDSPNLMKDLASNSISHRKRLYSGGEEGITTVEGFPDSSSVANHLPRRRTAGKSLQNAPQESSYDDYESSNTLHFSKAKWKKMLLLIIAITVHNIPEGLAVGVGFGAIGSSSSATFESARNLAIGIGIQNFPEGLAVSLPLKAAGFSTFRSFWYGQLSGMVEPVFGVLGAAAVSLARPALPYALAFAAGAMVHVVVDDLVPEAHASGNGKMASAATILGFVVMMVLDVGLG